MKVEIGDKVYANYGAMFPIVHGIVDRIDENNVVYFYDRYEPTEVYTTPMKYIGNRIAVENGEVPMKIGVYA
jgi:hypothetical protein